jgi:hypothetical protein
LYESKDDENKVFWDESVIKCKEQIVALFTRDTDNNQPIIKAK